jgi:hypothetical protein
MIAVESRIERCAPAEVAAKEPSVDGTRRNRQSLHAPHPHLSKTRPLGLGEMQLREMAVHLPGRQRQVHQR